MSGRYNASLLATYEKLQKLGFTYGNGRVGSFKL
jgi:hypothetical protein